MSFDRSLEVMYTLKISASYLLTSSRKLTKTENVDILKHVEITKFLATSKCDIFLDSLSKYKCTLKILALYLLPFYRN